MNRPRNASWRWILLGIGLLLVAALLLVEFRAVPRDEARTGSEATRAQGESKGLPSSSTSSDEPGVTAVRDGSSPRASSGEPRVASEGDEASSDPEGEQESKPDDQQPQFQVSFLDTTGAPLLVVEIGMEINGTEYDLEREEYEDLSELAFPLAELPSEIQFEYCDQTRELHISDAAQLQGVHEIAFQRKAVIHVEVSDMPESAKGCLAVKLLSPQDLTFIRLDYVDDDGYAYLDCLDPGSYTLSLLTAQRANTRGMWQILSSNVEVSGLEQTVSLEMPALHSLGVRCRGGVPPYSVEVENRDRLISKRGKLDESGETVMFQKLSEAEYEITVSSSKEKYFASREIRLTRDEIVELELEPVDCLEFVRLDDKGLLQQSGVREGDLLIGMNGKAIDSIDSLKWSMLGNLANPNLELMIQRNGELLTIKTDGANMKNSALKLVPASRNGR